MSSSATFAKASAKPSATNQLTITCVLVRINKLEIFSLKTTSMFYKTDRWSCSKSRQLCRRPGSSRGCRKPARRKRWWWCRRRRGRCKALGNTSRELAPRAWCPPEVPERATIVLMCVSYKIILKTAITEQRSMKYEYVKRVYSICIRTSRKNTMPVMQPTIMPPMCAEMPTRVTGTPNELLSAKRLYTAFAVSALAASDTAGQSSRATCNYYETIERTWHTWEETETYRAE